MIPKILLSILLLLTLAAAPNTTLQADSTRLVRLIGPVDAPMLLAPTTIMRLIDKRPKEIFILLNGPGGSTFIGDMVIAAIHVAQARGITVTCVTTLLIASMDFDIWHACTQRVALANSKLLFHPSRVMLGGGGMFGGGGEVITAGRAKTLQEQLSRIDQAQLSELCSEMATSEAHCAQVTEAFYQERLWTAEELAAFARPGYMRVVRDITGIPDMFSLMPAAAERKVMPDDDGV